jgi:hypothetical protein
MSKIIITKDGNKIKRVSRWIKIRADYNITNRHSLYEYCDKYNDNYIDYFIYKGEKYALSQFTRLNYPIMWEDEEGKLNFLSGYDSTNYYNPLLIEIEEGGEAIRLYEEVRED